MICPSCNQETEEGKFCTKCGEQLNQQADAMIENGSEDNIKDTYIGASQQENASTSETSSKSETSQQVNATLKKVKTGSNLYWKYFLTRFKNPNVAFKDNEQHVTNSIITAIIITLAASLFFYGLVNTLFNDMYSAVNDIFSFSESENSASLGDYVPFFSTIIKGIFIFLILFFTGLIANFIILNLVKHPASFVQQFTRYTGTLVPFAGLFVALAILSLLGVIKINLYQLGSFLMSSEESGFPLGISFMMILFIIVMFVNPILHMSYALTLEKTKQSFYYTILSLIITFAIIAIINNLFISEVLIGILESI